jgi:(4S)-4-hydroxy-5-phosphonooxypentane-2,3-dione isomerase
MIATCVHVWVKPESVEDFKKASIENHENSIKESGNFRFDILQDQSDLHKFVLYEAYESHEASTAHKQTAHYLKWRETVADMMAKPREGIAHNILAPLSN